jgi:preprotein translocase subunit SecA
MAAPMKQLNDRQLGDLSDELREEATSGTDFRFNELLVSAFAMVVEACRRRLAVELYDVQLLAGIVLAHGAIAEMHTGEGKTLAAVAPTVLHALRGQGAHVATVNQYLASRDYCLLQPVYETLRVSAGLLRDGADLDDKRSAYRCDVTYGTGYEFGFDYLRDQLTRLGRPRPSLGEHYRDALRGGSANPANPLQRGHEFAIIDEVDSVLIDEARVPLIISSAVSRPEEDSEVSVFELARRAAASLTPHRDFRIDEAHQTVHLTERGLDRADAAMPQSRDAALMRPWPIYVQQALQARLLLRQDADYVVRDGRIQIVDQPTGRIFADRSWRDGLHQAVEVKEGLAVTGEAASLARISRQRYFRLYQRLSGMTGTAMPSRHEFQQVYRLPVIAIPLRNPCRRSVLPPRFFVDQDSKWRDIGDEVEALHRIGRPVLIGTQSIDRSQRLASLLGRRGVAHRVLNGKQDAPEAEIVACAGELGAVTIATNMAGRGTDIVLSAGTLRRGGLHVIGEQRHDNARIDLQLMGRAARQGDPGSCQFFISADDDLICRHDPALRDEMRHSRQSRSEIKGNLEHRIDRIQGRIERDRRAQRRRLLRHDRWLEEVMQNLASHHHQPA